ncbi:MAG: hypothetical protein KC493_10375 [Bacteriovoracaceae bacterium]|nr:hypothetical protein [Bacteriovoracaceae bacterium]
MCLCFSHIFLLISCGPVGKRDGNKVPNESISFVKNAILCDQAQKGVKNATDHLIAMESLTSKVTRDYFVQRGVMYYSPGKFTYENMQMTPEKPLILSDEFFESEYKYIKENIKSYFPEMTSVALTTSSDLTPLNLEDEEFSNLKARLNMAAQLAVRYRNYSCQLDQLTNKKKNDIRPYFNLIDKECGDHQNENCLEHKLNNWKRSSEGHVKNDLVSVCKKIHSEAICLSMLSFSEMKKTMFDFYRKLKEGFQRKIFDPLFLLESKSPYISCTEIDNKKVLTIDLIVKPMDTVRFAGGLYSALAYVETAWSTDNIKLRVKHKNTGDQGPRVSFKEGVTSHVDSDTKSLITLNPKLQGLSLTKTLAHEIGHVIGFKDCYVEFFDPNERKLVYYELDRQKGNIMCSLERGYKAPDDYIKQLADHYCR